jgi:RNA polymerase sigma-70 factor, ECF subfamily
MIAAMMVHTSERAAHDSVLINRFNAGDEAAFSEIVSRYRERVSSVAYSMLKNHADAEEIAQDTFIRAHRGLATFRGDSSLATWLHRIALNLSRNRYWYFSRRRRHSTLSLDYTDDNNQTSLVNLLATGDACPAREVVTKEFMYLIAKGVEGLGDNDRHILMLRNTLDRSYEEIARELKLNPGTVKSRLARARRKLRLLLAKENPEMGSEMALSDWFNTFGPTSRVSRPSTG